MVRLLCLLSLLSWLSASSSFAQAVPVGRLLNIVAHQDDDIGQLNPSVFKAIRAGTVVQTVYLTAGDAGFGCESYVVGRERGIKLAYEKMAGLAASGDHWRADTLVTVAGKRVRVVAMKARPITLVFVGIVNTALTMPNALLRLWSGEVGQVTTFKDSRLGNVIETYSREQLIELLRALIVGFDPQQLNTLDATGVWPPTPPFEHPEHVAAARFALAARDRTRSVRTTRLYRGYNIIFEIPNLDAADTAFKREVWNAYWPHDRKICRTGITNVCAGGGALNLQLCDESELTYGALFSREYFLTP